jgi:hypothetical protein
MVLWIPACGMTGGGGRGRGGRLTTQTPLYPTCFFKNPSVRVQASAALGAS